MMKRFGLGLLSTLAIAFIAIGWSHEAMAQKWPSKPITVIVAWSAGGGSDRSMRLVAATMSKKIGVNVIVVNKPGAGGALGTRAMATAKPDGYTIGMVGSGVVARQYTNPTANKLSDLEPLVFFGADPGALSARADTGFKNVADFVKAAKAAPGKIKNGNDQPGGSSYINIAVIEAALGLKVTRVPYKGYAPTVAAMLAGEVQTATVPIPDAIEHHKAGKIRILGVMDESRHFMAKDVPTFKEQGFNVVVGSWRALVAPKGVPAARLKILENALLATLKDPEFLKRATAAGFIVSPMGAKATKQRMLDHDKALYPVLLAAGLVKANKK
jgi:tripartite-type tricarboxylate transporter receptor subunit TctC